jgi:DNA-3-methyladenine glycosylase
VAYFIYYFLEAFDETGDLWICLLVDLFIRLTIMKFIPDYKKSLPVEFFRRNTLVVAKELIGKVLVRIMPDASVIAAKLVETEAYRADGDLSCHAAVGKTQRNAPLFENGGILYVYKIYGFHHCVNIVTETDAIGSGVLLRAAEPICGIEAMKRNRNSGNLHSLCKGPGNLAKAFGFNLGDKFLPVTQPTLFVQADQDFPEEEIGCSPRIGVTKSRDLPYRFFIKNSLFVSGKKN